MSLVDHMQISIGNGNSPRIWLDAYHAPLIPVAPGFSWQCDLGRWRSLEPCFALCAKREFLWLVVASQCQMSSDINILYHSYQQLVHITRNGLNTKCSLHFSAYFTFLSILVNFPLTGNDICHSQPKSWYFIISNASCSINLFLAQWRHISSESVVLESVSITVLIAKGDAQSKAWDILLY